MKHFTLVTLSILLAGREVYTAAGDTPKTGKGLLGSLPLFVNEAIYGMTHAFSARKDWIKAKLVVPTPKSATDLVPYNPTENYCIAATETEYWKALYKETDPGIIEKIIFCPDATVYLKNLNAAKLVANAEGNQLRAILSALMLRRETLINLYSESFIESQFLNCFHTLWSKVQSTDPAQMDYWPCNQELCNRADISDNFRKLMTETESCRAVLLDQLTAYSQKVLEAVDTNNIKSAPSLREAIRENLNDTPHLALSFASVADTVVEGNKIAAAANIESVLADVKSILKMQSKGMSTVYADAENCFNSKFSGGTSGGTPSASSSYSSSSADTSTKVQPQEPTKTKVAS